MEKKFLPQLCGVELSANKLEAGEPLFITTRWKNAGEEAADFRGRIVADIEFFGYQRLEETSDLFYCVKWAPYPAMFQWRTGEIVASTGKWFNKSGTWGGTYNVVVSLTDDDGNRIPFIGKDGNIVTKDKITRIDIGWGLGRKRLWETDRYENNVYVTEFTDRKEENNSATLDGFWRFDSKLPVPVGCGKWSFSAEPIEIHAREIETDTHYKLHKQHEIRTELIKAEKNEVRYKVSVFCGSLDIVYSGNADVINLELQNIEAKEGFEIINVYFPNLVSGNDKTQMVDLWFGGRLVSVKDTMTLGISHRFDTDELGAFYDDEQQIVVDTKDLNALMHQSINEINGKKIGMLGMELFIMQPAYKAGLKSIMLNEPCSCRIQRTKPGWNEDVFILRNKYNSKPHPLYDRAVLYKFLTDWGPKIPQDAKRLSKPMTISEMEKVLADIHKAFDGAPQIAYVGGWQNEGHDTGYPNVDKHPINPRMGGNEEDFVKFIASGDKYNAIVSLHDNFGDTYAEPDASFELVGIDCFGEYNKCWIWCGGQGYIQNYRKFVESGRARERITNTVKRFGIKKTYLLDGLTAEPLFSDFDPQNPSTFKDNNEYRKEVLKIFDELGINVASENLTSPLMGHYGVAWATRDKMESTYYPGETHIPLFAMACHGLMHYSMYANGDYMDRARLLWGISYGGTLGFGDIFKLELPHINGYYIQALPMNLLDYEKMLKCDLTDDYINVDYTNDCHVYCDKKNLRYEIVKNGTVIGKDFTTFAPGFKEGTYLAYADADCTVVYDAPAGFENAYGIEFLNGDKEVPLTIKDGKITLTLTANQPMRVVKK